MTRAASTSPASARAAASFSSATGEPVLELGDPAPVLWLVGVERCERSLKDVWPSASQRERAIELGPSALDLLGVPEGSVLIAQQHDLAVREPRLSPGVVDDHEGQEAVHLRLVRHQVRQRTAEADRLGGEIRT